MGDFSASEFEWHADAAFFRPDRTAEGGATMIVNPETQQPRPGSNTPCLPPGMDTEALEKTEYFKAALFELVMRRAAATMEMAKQDQVSNERERFAVARIEIHFDTNMFKGHDNQYSGTNPAGFGFIRENYEPCKESCEKRDLTFPRNLAVRVMIDWSDSSSSLDAVWVLNAARLSCHTGG